MNKIARIAEKSGHYPDIAVQNFSEVSVRTITPSVGEVTGKDLELAKKINKEYDAVKYDERR